MRLKATILGIFMAASAVAAEARADEPNASYAPPNMSPIEDDKRLASFPHPMMCQDGPSPKKKQVKPQPVCAPVPFPNV